MEDASTAAHPAVAAWMRSAMRGPGPGLTAELSARVSRLPVAQLCDVAAAHRVGPWLAAALETRRDGTRSDVASELGRIALGSTLHTMVQLQELVALLATLGEHEVDVIVLKGPSIADRYYPEPGLRPYGDIDLLLHERDEAVATTVLLERGFSIHTAEDQGPLHHDHGSFQQIFVREDGCVVEVHFDHLQIGLRPAEMDEVWSRAVPHEFGGQPALVIEANDLFVHLCVHLQRHGYERLIWFKDLDLMVRSGELDWDVIRVRAEHEGCTSVVAYTLDLLRDMLDTPLPGPALELISERSALARAVQSVVWPRRDILDLRPQRKWRLRRLTQFAPEHGVRGGIPAILAWGRRGAKVRVLFSALRSLPTRRAQRRSRRLKAAARHDSVAPHEHGTHTH